MTARQVADVLYELETLMVLHGEDEFKSKAYGRAARALETGSVDIEAAVREGRATSVPGIGKGLAPEVTEIVESGSSAQLERLRLATPPGLMEILRIRGVGPKKVRAFWTQLGVESLGELEYACVENRVAGLSGFGAKSQEKILVGIEDLKKNRGKMRLDVATTLAEEFLARLDALPSVTRAAIAGRVRRGFEYVDALSFVVESASPERLGGDVEAVGLLEDFRASEERVIGRLDGTIAVRIDVARPGTFPAVLHGRTGAHDHAFMFSIPLHDRGFDLRSDGLYRDGELVRLESEEDLFEIAGVQYIPPELREGIDEVPRAIEGKIPTLIEAADLRGMLHVHSTWSDGQNSIVEIAEHVRSLGCSYLLMCDHSKAAFYANGLDERRLEAQGKEIDEINKRYDPTEFRVLKGIECDILADGSMDLSDDVLASLDAVVGSIHSNFNLSPEVQTDRLCRALENPWVTMLGHPTGRLILSRNGYDPDLRRVIETAARLGKSIELNANPHRLDLSWRMIRFARHKGVKIAINPDAHSLAGFAVMRYGVTMARKGMLTREDVVNAMDAERFLEFVAGTRRISALP